MLKKINKLSIPIAFVMGITQFSTYSGAQTIAGALDYLERGQVAKALKDLKSIADRGDGEASYVLGDIYLLGDSVKQSDNEAMKWFRISSKLGNPDAQFKLGLLYSEGTNIKRDLKKAYLWVFISYTQNKEADVKKYLFDIEKRLSSQEVLRLKREAESCVAVSYKNCD
jgi:hypothetical protein